MCRPPPSVPPLQASVKILRNYSSVRSAFDLSEFELPIEFVTKKAPETGGGGIQLKASEQFA